MQNKNKYINKNKKQNIFEWLDQNSTNKNALLINQLVPIIVCFVLFFLFVILTHLFITKVINPNISEKILINFYPVDFLIGFFLYFVTAIDYALIIGRMQTTNPGAKARLVMNIFTCLGCFFGVSLILFIWGYAKEFALVIFPILIFAGSVMVKLAYEGREFYQHSNKINVYIKGITTFLLNTLYYPSRVFSFWVPELGKPTVDKMPISHLAKWSFFLPFIIGLDDFIGYLGAMTLYNAFSLIIGIYLADVVIDILIFVSPKFTTKVVENAVLSLLAAYAFLYLAFKSFSEAYHLLIEKLHVSNSQTILGLICFILLIVIWDYAAIFYRQKVKGFLKEMR